MSRPRPFAITLIAVSSIVLGVLGFVGVLAGCNSNNDNGLGNYTSTLDIFFNPMYSGYDGVHTYQVPATIDNGNNAMSVTGVTWSASDSSLVDLTPAPNGTDVMITTKGAGDVVITATTDNAIGKAPLHITSFTPDQWAAGQTRYTSGDSTTLGMQLHGSTDKYVQCTSCHGTMAAIEHTPEQTGGFSDEEMKGIILHGTLPPQDLMVDIHGGAAQFKAFHQWMVASDDEANGLVAYLRSLPPKAQGMIDFGGHGHHHGDGGWSPPDGGMAGW